MEFPEIELTTTYTICAAHKLFRDDWDEEKNKAVFGKCASIHGHEYRMEVTITGKISQTTGMLINSFDLDHIIQEGVYKKLDHHYLNEDIPFFREHQPTAEWIAVYAHREIQADLPSYCQLKRVRIYETPTLYATYTG